MRRVAPLKSDYLDRTDPLTKLDPMIGDHCSVESPVLEGDHHPAAFRDIGACDESHGGSSGEFGIRNSGSAAVSV